VDAVLCGRWRGRALVSWWPSAAAVQAGAANHRELLRSRAVVVSVGGESRRERGRCGSRRRARANH
jgi:hypothetical protein